MMVRSRLALTAIAMLVAAGLWLATSVEAPSAPAHSEQVPLHVWPLASAVRSPTTKASLPTREPPPTVPALLDEQALMIELRRANNGDPELALSLARDGNRRFPESAEAPERASIIVHALSTLGQSSEGRAEAEDMVNRYPDSEWVREVERFTGAHRHRNLRTNAAGQLEYY